MTGPRAGQSLGTTVAWSVAAVVIGVCTVSLLLGSPLPLILLLGVLVGLAFTFRPRWAATLLLTLWCTVVPVEWGSVPLGPLTMTAAETLLVAALGGVVLRKVALSSAGPHWARGFGGPVGAVIFAAAFGALVGVLRDEATGEALAAFRAMLTIGLFWVLRDAYRGRPDRLARVLVVAALAGAAITLIGAGTGIGTGARVVGYVITAGQKTDVTRLDPPALRLTTVSLLLLLAGAVLKHRVLLRAALILVLVILEALSFTRSTWLPLVLAGLALPVLVSHRTRWLVLLERLVLVTVLGGILLAAAGSGLLGHAGVSVVQRLASTTNEATITDSSLLDREYEAGLAIHAISRHPVTGVGLNLGYGAVNQGWDPLLATTVSEPRRHIHNSYLGVWVWLGLPGVLAFLWMLVRGVRSGLAVHHLRHTVDIAPPVACLLGLGVLAVQSSFQTNLLYPPALAALAAGLAYVEVWLGAQPPAGGRPTTTATTPDLHLAAGAAR